MSRSVKEIAWVAGILEGEGCFSINKNSPAIRLGMTDLDVVERARSILKKNAKINTPQSAIGKNGNLLKQRYLLTLIGNIAIQWMMTIYPLMGFRRKMKIQEIIHHWKTHTITQKGMPVPFSYREKTMIQIFMATGLSRAEAEIKALELLTAAKSKE